MQRKQITRENSRTHSLNKYTFSHSYQTLFFFMDVEGFYDPSTNSSCFNYKLFTICSLLSGFQMYNVSKHIYDGDLDKILVRQLYIIDEKMFPLQNSCYCKGRHLLAVARTNQEYLFQKKTRPLCSEVQFLATKTAL